MRKEKSLQPEYFEALYQSDPDPWKFATSPYEQTKYDQTILALAGERSSRALEVGCSIGVLTRRLAAQCDALVATDLSETALTEARTRCADLDTVQFRRVASATGSFDRGFDLVVLSEVVYYWDDADLAAVGAAIRDVLQSRGRILLVHWLGLTNFPRSADEAVAGLADALGQTFDVERESRTNDYRLDLWRWR